MDAENGVSLEEDQFEDAVEQYQPMSCMDMETAVEEARVALNLFLNNRFELAKARMEPWAKDSMYHALGYATIVFIKAMMTYEQADIEQAVQITKQASEVCHRFRRHNGTHSSLSKFVRSSDHSLCTDEEMHAELCYAETLLQRAVLTFVQDENLVSFVKGALKIRACYQSYKECQRMLSMKQSWANGNEKLRAHFESGVLMGVGAFNLMMSILPSRVLRLMELVGFSGDKSYGLQQLTAGSAGSENTLRGPLCSLILLAWNLIFTFLMSTGDGDLQLCERLLAPLRHSYPKATCLLQDSVLAQSEWKQFHHLCYWELAFCYAFMRRWSDAAMYAYKLCAENRWSRCTYSYMCAVFILAKGSAQLTSIEKDNVQKLLRQVPALKVRIAGKSIPMEKFCVVKANRFIRKGDSLVMPHYELLYLWNGFTIMGQDVDLVKPLLYDVEALLREHSIAKNLDVDDYCLCLLLKAMCLKHLQSPFQAEQCLIELVTYEKSISDNYYLVPHAFFELSILKLDEQNLPEAKRYLLRARDYKGYLMESRLHFRMHALNERLSIQSPV